MDRLTTEIAAARRTAGLEPAIDDARTTAAATTEQRGVARDIESPPPPPHQDHLRELDASVGDAASRWKWLLVDERNALQYFGTPSRIWVTQGVAAEYWVYDLGEGRTRQLVFNRGRLIDIR